MLNKAPDMCSITLLRGIDGHPNSGGPAFTTSFKTERHGVVPEDFTECDGARVRFEDSPRPGRAIIRFTAVGHFCEEEPRPNLWEITYEATEQAVNAFKVCVEEDVYFIWFISTPEFEGRAVVNQNTGTISDKYLIYRDLQ